jgi:hypothetical protein
MKYGLNRIIIYTKLFTQQVASLNGEGIEVHPWGSRIKLHK